MKKTRSTERGSVSKVLTFGHIPKFFGGQQQQGLANAMWATASAMASQRKDYEVVFCATDIYKLFTVIGGLNTLGWTRFSLLAFLILAPARSIRLISKIVPLCKKYELQVVRTVFKALHLQRSISIVRPDFMHLHTCEAVVFIESGVVDAENTIVTIHGIFGRKGPIGLNAMERALSSKNLLSLVFVSSNISNEWIETYGVSNLRSRVIQNAFDRNQFFFEGKTQGTLCQGSKKVCRLLTIGTVCDRKGQKRVISALNQLKSNELRCEFKYTIVGDDPQGLIKEFLELALESNTDVDYIPYLPPEGLRGLLAEVDFMILPSSNEGYGLVFTESIACGVPVVLPKDLPICEEPNLLSEHNSVLLESCSSDAIFDFLCKIQSFTFERKGVSDSLPDLSWEKVGLLYCDAFTEMSRSKVNNIT